MHPQIFTDWCESLSDGFIGPYFFEIDDDEAITINDESYRILLTDFGPK